MAGLYSHTTRSSGTTLTAAIYNADHVNHITNHVPSQMDDYSDDIAEMQAQTDPGEDGTESQATSLAGEIERLRFIIAEITGNTYWYETPASNLSTGTVPEIFAPAAAFKPDSTSPCANLASNDIGVLEQSYLAFDKTSDERANVQVMSSPGWSGATMEIAVYWSAPTGTTSGNVVWDVKLENTGDGITLTGASDSTEIVTDGHNGADALNVTSALSYSTLGFTARNLLTVQIQRDANNGADTLNSDAWFMGLRIKFT